MFVSGIEMDGNKFFREASLRIMSDLNIEKSLHSLFIFLKDLMPVKKMDLQFYDDTLESVKTIAVITEEAFQKADNITPLSKEGVMNSKNLPEEKNAFFISDPEKFATCREITNHHTTTRSSVIVLFLRLKDTLLGSLILQSDGEQTFNRLHVDLIEYLREPIFIAVSNNLKHIEVSRLTKILTEENQFLHNELRDDKGNEIIGVKFGLKEVMDQADKVAKLESPVLLLGETGVGKDVLANAIHLSSLRREGPFIKVNCGAIPDSLIDSELFGHEKGSFTGAISQKLGRFERANKGTIFLDEIGELPLQAQVRLLNVLQKKEIERVGGTKTIPLDIRVIAATNRNLEEMVKEKEFREDLWFRLNVFPIKIPPLRERKTDIPALIDYFIREKSKELKLPGAPILGRGVMENLRTYKFPGNVRELQNLVERELILSPRGPLLFSSILASSNSDSNGELTLDELNKRHITKVLEKTDGVIHGKNGAAKILGVNANTLRHRMTKLGIEFKKS